MLNLKPIKVRLSAVPAPPWSEFCESGNWWMQPADVDGGPRDDTVPICSSNASDMDQPIVDFLVAAPADMQALITEVERLRAALAQAVRMKTIKGARRIVADVLGE